MIPSNGQMKVWKAASTRAGLATQMMNTPSRGKSDPNKANRQPILLTSSLAFYGSQGTANRSLAGWRLLLSLRPQYFLSQRIGTLWVVRCFLFAFSGHFLNAHQLEPESDYAVEDAVEVGVVNNLPREDHLPAFRLHFHPFEGCGVSFADLPAHCYLVDRSCAHRDLCRSPLFTTLAKRNAQQDGLSSPSRTFPLGDFQAGSANRKTPKECCLSILIVQIDDQAKVAGAVAAPPSSRSAPGCSSPSGTLRLDRGAVKKAATLGKRSLKQHPCRGDSIDP